MISFFQVFVVARGIYQLLSQANRSTATQNHVNATSPVVRKRGPRLVTVTLGEDVDKGCRMFTVIASDSVMVTSM